MTFQSNLKTQEESEVAESENGDGEGTECDSSPRTAAMPGRCDKEHHGKRSVSPFSSFSSPNSIPQIFLNTLI
jgi:hypothetical protein